MNLRCYSHLKCTSCSLFLTLKNTAQYVQLMKKFITKTKQNYFVSENVNSILKRNALLRLSCVLNKLRTICKRIRDAYASTDYTEGKKKLKEVLHSHWCCIDKIMSDYIEAEFLFLAQMQQINAS